MAFASGRQTLPDRLGAGVNPRTDQQRKLHVTKEAPMKAWPVHDAKARFSELLDACLREGPQLVTRQGEQAAVLVPIRGGSLRRPGTPRSRIFCSAMPAGSHDRFPRVAGSADAQRASSRDPEASFHS